MINIRLYCDVLEAPFEVERYELRVPREGETYLYYSHGLPSRPIDWREAGVDFRGSPHVIAIPKKKIEYQWPEEVANGVKLYRNSWSKEWLMQFPDSNNKCEYYFSDIRKFFPYLPDPPKDCPIDTVFVKGQK